MLDEGAGTIIRVIDAQIRGSDVAEAASDTFMVVSENEVAWRDLAEEGGATKQITSDTAVAVHLILPGWLPFSVEATERTGNFVMAQVIEQVRSPATTTPTPLRGEPASRGEPGAHRASHPPSTDGAVGVLAGGAALPETAEGGFRQLD